MQILIKKLMLAQDLHEVTCASLKYVIMIIKLNSLISISRQTEESIQKPLTIQDRIKGDRLVMAILFSLVTIAAIIFA